MSRILPFNDVRNPMGKFVNVEFGNPKKRNCEGMGICNVELANAKKNVSACCQACFSSAFLTYSPEKEEIQLLINRNDISNSAYKKQFSGGLFRVEVDFIFPVSLTRAFGLLDGAHIKKGLYSFHEIEGKLCLPLPVAIAKELSQQITDNHLFAATA